MGTLEELLTEHGIKWDPQVVDRGRVGILRRFRQYREEFPVAMALRLAYVDVEAGAPEEPRTGSGCPAAGSGCSGCPSAGF